jgi:hypothetical protein
MMQHSKWMTALFVLTCAAGAAHWWGQRTPAEPQVAKPSVPSHGGERSQHREPLALPFAQRSSAVDSSSPALGSEPSNVASAADPAAPADSPAALADTAGAIGSPASASALDDLADALPEVRAQVHEYQRALRRARADVDEYQRSMQALQASTLAGRPNANEERALEQRRDELLAQARGLGQQALHLNDAIRGAAGVSLD